jgi:hypothetical protein
MLSSLNGPDMPASPNRQPGWREALALTAAFWAAVFVVFALPSAITSAPANETPLFLARLALLFGPMSAFGVLFSLLVYALGLALRGRSVGLRASMLGIAVLGAAIAHGVLDAAWWTWFGEHVAPGKGPPGGFMAVAQTSALIYVGFYAFYVAGVNLTLTSLAFKNRERELAEARAAAHQAQAAALRFQLNPHFLFNTLNALSSLVVTGRNEDAELMIGKLSDFLRATINSDPEGEVPLDDELATLQAYLDIEAVRFGDRLSVEVVSPAHLLDALVPSFLLQPLAENAVKYGVAPSRRPVSIRVEARQDGEDLVVSVEDDGGQAFGVLPKGGTGVGLANIRKRLSAAYGGRGQLEATARERGWQSTVRLPLHRAAAPDSVSVAA